MGKAKKDIQDLEKEQDKSYQKDIIKNYGNILKTADSILDEDRKVFSLTPRLDVALGGGILDGSWCTFSGNEKIGKTSLALQFCSNMQRPENGSRHIFYNDVEERLKKRDVRGIHGLMVTGDMFTYMSSEDGLLSAEDNLSICESILKNEKEIVLVIDSLGALSTDAELTGKITDMQRGDAAKLIAKFIRRNTQWVRQNKNIVILINQLYGNASGLGAEFKETGGRKVGYVAEVRLRGKMVERWKEGETQIGQKVKWEVLASGISGTGTQMDCFLRYGYGIDTEAEILELAKEIDIVSLKGAWYSYGDFRCQGEAKMISYLRENPEVANDINKQVRAFYGLDNN